MRQDTWFLRQMVRQKGLAYSPGFKTTTGRSTACLHGGSECRVSSFIPAVSFSYDDYNRFYVWCLNLMDMVSP